MFAAARHLSPISRPLSASGSGDESVTLTAPPAGTYYYSACVDAVPGESDTANNCSSSVAVRVTVPVTRPDLAVVSPSVSDVRPGAGGTFTFSATVGNVGDSASASTTLRFSTSDTPLGTESVDGLNASGRSAGSIPLTAPSTPGTYYYGACVDQVPDETNTANNCSRGVAVTVTEPPPPDLAVSASSSTVGREPGCNSKDPAIRASATVRNVGAGNAPATTLRYYRSSDATVSADDAELGSVVVPALAASGSWGHNLESDLVAGTHYYYACADPAPIEQRRANNCSEPQRIATSALSPPDLAVIRLRAVKRPANRIIVGVIVKNLGDRTVTYHRARVCRSTDREFTSCETVAVLLAGETFPVRSECVVDDGATSRTTGSISGTYYYRGCVEAVAPEDANPENDCSQIMEVVH